MMDAENNNVFGIVKDFTADLCNTFPEIKDNLHEGLVDILRDETTSENSNSVLTYLEETYPPHLFDILNKNEEIFANSAYFLPGIDFSVLWKENISDNTKDIIWKYLLLISFSVSSKANNFESFGAEAEKIFENLNEDEFKEKINEAFNDMSSMFENRDSSNINLEDLPNADQMHSHLSGLLDSKLGKLAHEIAEETASSMNLDGLSSVDDVVKNLMSNPAKLSSLVKNVTSKLDQKINSGDLDEKELMEDANSILKNISSMPGLGNINNLFNMMSGGLGGKVNKGAMQQNLSKMNARDRLRKKLEQRKQQQETQEAQEASHAQQALEALQAHERGLMQGEKEEKKWTVASEEGGAEKTPRVSKNKNKKRKKKNNNKK